MDEKNPAATPAAQQPVAVGTPVPPADPQQPPISSFAQPLQKVKPSAGAAPQAAPIPKSGNPLLKIVLVLLIVAVVIGLVIFFWPKGKSTKVNLVWWGLWEDQKIMKPLIDDFERDHPNITVEY